MKKAIERASLAFLIREIFYICLSLGAVGFYFWFLHQISQMGWF